jgi:DNA-binding CsgD family transcriptional regulator
MVDPARNNAVVAVLVVGLQAIAAVYFLADAVQESGGRLALVDFIVGGALLAGTLFGGAMVRRLLAEAERREAALALARGAIGDLIRQRFAAWGLSPSEAEVALFALKGCTIADIARMRGSASGTVRSQLSQVYAKAGVTGQPMLMSLFLDELVDAGDGPGKV